MYVIIHTYGYTLWQCRHLCMITHISYYRMCSLTIECVLLLHSGSAALHLLRYRHLCMITHLSYYRMCSLTIECVLLLHSGSAALHLLRYRHLCRCSLSFCRMCSLTIECVLLLHSGSAALHLVSPSLQVFALFLYHRWRECACARERVF